MSETLGGFEHKVLLAMVRLGGEAYSVPVVRELERAGDTEVAPAAVYVTLRRLERRDLLTSVMRAPEEGEGGPPRRVFRVEPRTIEVLRAVRADLEDLWDGVEALEI